jgi:hypothetical protein
MVLQATGGDLQTASRRKGKRMKSIKLLLLAIFASTALVGCVSHTHERVVVEKPVDRTVIVTPP